MSVLEKNLEVGRQSLSSLECFKKANNFIPNNVTVEDVLRQELNELEGKKDSRSELRRFEILRMLD